jgi:allatostatin A receptor
VTAYVIILLLVLMSLDRYLAISSFSNVYRNSSNAIKAVKILWMSMLLINIPHLFLWTNYEYVNEMTNDNRTVCILKYNINNENETTIFKIRAYYFIFFMFGYVLPFIAIFILYGLIMLKLKRAKGQQAQRAKSHVTLMVIVVVTSFVLCWGPLQCMLFLQHVIKYEVNETFVIILVISNCIAYLNTCINPIIYGFANQDFRS